MKDLYTENYKKLKKETPMNGKISHIYGLKKYCNIVEMSIPPKAIYRYTAILIKIPMILIKI